MAKTFPNSWFKTSFEINDYNVSYTDLSKIGLTTVPIEGPGFTNTCFVHPNVFILKIKGR